MTKKSRRKVKPRDNFRKTHKQRGGVPPPPLMLAAFKGDEESVKQLVDFVANVNETDDDGNTALIMAAMKNNPQGNQADIVKFLLDNGANANDANNNKKTALDVAVDKATHEHLKIINVLLGHENAPDVTNYDFTEINKKIAQTQADGGIGSNNTLIMIRDSLLDGKRQQLKKAAEEEEGRAENVGGGGKKRKTKKKKTKKKKTKKKKTKKRKKTRHKKH